MLTDKQIRNEVGSLTYDDFDNEWIPNESGLWVIRRVCQAQIWELVDWLEAPCDDEEHKPYHILRDCPRRSCCKCAESLRREAGLEG